MKISKFLTLSMIACLFLSFEVKAADVMDEMGTPLQIAISAFNAKKLGKNKYQLPNKKIVTSKELTEMLYDKENRQGPRRVDPISKERELPAEKQRTLSSAKSQLTQTDALIQQIQKVQQENIRLAMTMSQGGPAERAPRPGSKRWKQEEIDQTQDSIQGLQLLLNKESKIQEEIRPLNSVAL